MLLIITCIVVFLVAINFFLLAFSCNKTSKRDRSIDKSKIIINTRSSKKPASSHLAPTGS